jgi:hypothetical protein
MWARSGRELFFRSGPAMMAVDVSDRGTDFSVGTPRQLFSGNFAAGGVRAGYDVAADGERFLLVKDSVEPADPRRFHIVVNWLEELSGRLSRGRR